MSKLTKAQRELSKMDYDTLLYHYELAIRERHYNPTPGDPLEYSYNDLQTEVRDRLWRLEDLQH